MQFTLKELRARKNVTQAQAAKDLGISVTTYNKWEKDLSRVSVVKVAKVAQYFGVQLDELKITGISFLPFKSVD